MFEKLLIRITKYPWLTTALLLVLSGGFFISLKRNSRMETDLDEYMPGNHPAFTYSDQAEELFNIKDGIIFAIESSEGIYNPVTLQKIKDLTLALQARSEIDKEDVTSLYTADNIIGGEYGLEVASFYHEAPSDPGQLEALRRAVENNEMVHRRLVSEDGTVALVIARIGDDVFSQEFYGELLDLADRHEGPETVYVAGRPIVEGTMALLAPRDMKKMVPIVILVITLVLFAVLRNVSAVAATLLVVILSTLWTFGLMAALKIPIYAVSTMIPVMLIAIGVADGIHLYSHLRLYLRAHPSATKREAVTDMLSSMWKPVVMTSITTAVGFAALLTSSVYPIRYFGIFTGFGVMAAMGFSLVLIPAFIILTGVPRVKFAENGPHPARGTRFAEVYSRAVVKYKTIALFVTIVLIGTSLFGITRVWINSSFLDKFEKNSNIVLTDQFINARFGGTSTLNVVLESEIPGVFKQPGVLETIDSLQTKAESLEMVGSSFSLADYLKRMNKVMHADSSLYETIPESRDLVAQYILLYEMSGDPENLVQLVDYDYRTANVTLQLKGDDSKTIKEALAVVNEYEPEFEKHGITVNFAGSGYKTLVFTDLILYGQISSLVLSLVIVVVLISALFGSIKLGLVGAVPIALTGLMSFGFMGLANIPLSTTTALLSSIALGIGIDYAIHFIERFRHHRMQTSDIETVSAKTMNSTGRAILFNALVVVAGFLVLLFSVFPPNRVLGLLVSFNMTLTFIATVTIMYLLLRTFAPSIWKGAPSRDSE